MDSPVFKKKLVKQAMDNVQAKEKEKTKEFIEREKLKRQEIREQEKLKRQELKEKLTVKRKEQKLEIKKAKSFKSVINEMVARVPHQGEIPDEILSTIMEIEDKEGRQMTRQQLMVHALIGRAMQGNVDAFRELLDRTEGKVANRNENKNLNVTYEDWLKQQAGTNPMGENPEDEEE